LSNTTPPPPSDPNGNPYASTAPEQPLNPSDEKTYAIVIHVLGIFFNFIPALIGYLVWKDRGPFIRSHTASALNFQLTMLIAMIVGYITLIIVVGVFIILAVYVVTIVFSIIAAMRANQGLEYKYPMSIPFVK